mgnify:CR=1 FL=1
MSLDQNQIAQDLAQAIASINAAKDLEALKQVKIDYVGDKSPLAKANQALATVDKSLRAEFGKIIGLQETPALPVLVNETFVLTPLGFVIKIIYC